jgi:flagellar basal-body rod protein FlgC
MIDIIPAIQVTSSALNAERIRSDAIAQNLAHAMIPRSPGGEVYQRQKVVFENVLQQFGGSDGLPGVAAPGILNVRVESDTRPPRLVADPSNPGRMMEVPDINVHQEMADLIVSQRSYEANLAVAKSARSMALQTLSIGRRA